MNDTTTSTGGFAGDPAAALPVTGTTGCCGSADTADAPAPTVPVPCCGTTAEAAAEGSCCGNEAKTEAVAAGQGCCV